MTTESRQLFELWAASEGYDLTHTEWPDSNSYRYRDTRHAWAGWEQSRLHVSAWRREPRVPVLLDVRKLGQAIAQPHCVRGEACVCVVETHLGFARGAPTGGHPCERRWPDGVPHLGETHAAGIPHPPGVRVRVGPVDPRDNKPP